MTIKSTSPRELFAQLVAECPPEDVDARLAEIRQQDAALADRVKKLLQAHQDPQSFLDRPLSPTVSFSESPIIGAQIGPYRLREQIGEGGFGVVYVAEQQKPIRRKVALKIIKPGMDSKEIIARFEAERQALALMDHPNIAKVLDAGTTGEPEDVNPRTDDLASDLRPLTAGAGRPYFVMELVRGVPITTFCDKEKLTTEQRLRLFTDVCRAVQHAHQKGIIHRDIKPTNVLVTLHDGKPVPKVIDFGVAKALSQQLTENTLYTAMGQMVGTPMYMSPEQAEMSGLDVDTRSDVYSLGVLLYELLTGSTPFDRETLKNAGLDGMRRIIRETEPVKPSARISTLKNEHGATISDQRRVDARRLEQALRGDLDWVVMKALEKDRNRRYESASAFAADIERHLNNEPVVASPPSAGYRIRKFIRRKRQAVAITAVLSVVLLVLVGVAGWVARDRAAQQSLLRREVTSALADVERLLQEGRPRAALSAAERTTGMLARWKGDPALVSAAEQRHKDVQMVLRLEEIRLEGSAVDPIAGSFDIQRTARLYEQAFHDYGWELSGANSQKIASEIRERPDGVRIALLAGLNNYTLLIRERGQLGFGVNPEKYRIVSINPHSPAAEAELNVGDQITGIGDSADDIVAINKMPPTEHLQRARGVGGSQVSLRVQSADRSVTRIVTLVRRTGWHELVDILRAADEDNWRRDFWDALTHDDVDALRALAARDELRSQPAVNFELLSHYLDSPLAIDVMRRAHDTYPGDFWVNHQLAVLLARANPPAPDEAIGFYQAALALHPENAGVRLNLGNAFKNAGQMDAAVAQYHRAIELQPDYSGVYINLALVLREQKKWDQAIAACRKAIELQGDNASWHHALGNTLRDAGRLDEAVQALRKSNALRPNDAHLHNSLGVTLSKMGDIDGKLTAYREAVRLEPQDAFLLGNLAAALEDHGDLDEAIATWEAALVLEKEPTLGWTKGHLEVKWARFHLDGLLARTGQWDRIRSVVFHDSAEDFELYLTGKFTGMETEPNPVLVIAHDDEFFSKVIARMPHDYRPWEARGWAFAVEGQWDRSAADYAQAMEAIGNGGDWFGRETDLAERIAQRPEVLERVLALRPGDARLRVARVRTLAVARQWQEAADALELLAEENPDDNWHWHFLALLNLNVADIDGYRRACGELLTRHARHGYGPVQLVAAAPCLLSATILQDRFEEVRAIIDDTRVRGVPPIWNDWLDLLSGLAAYRSGDLGSARRFAAAAIRGPTDKPFLGQMLQAMVEYRESRPEQARTAYFEAIDLAALEQAVRGESTVRRNINYWLMFELLRREAAELLQIDNDASVGKAENSATPPDNQSHNE